MKSEVAFKSKFADYLSRRVSHDKKETLFRGEFTELPSNSPHSNASSRAINLSSHHTQQNNDSFSFSFLKTPKSNASSSSFNSSEFEYSNYRSSTKKVVEGSTQRKRLKKLRELEQNQCAICLDQIKNRCQLECKHRFCYDCLQEWLNNSSKCPYCRADVQRFWFKGEEFKVKAKEFEYQPEEEQNLDWVCYLCDHTQDGDIVLICDRCEANACHIDCDQLLHGVQPRGEWFCHFCR